MFEQFLKDEAGSTAIEYGLIAALVSFGIIGALTSFSDNVVGLYNYVVDSVGAANAPEEGGGQGNG